MLPPDQGRGWHDNYNGRRSLRQSTVNDVLLLPLNYFTDDSDPESRREKLYRSSKSGKLSIAVLSRKSSKSYTHISRLPPSFLEYFSQITALRLGCGLERLPPQIAQLRQLKSLDVRGNLLVSLPSQIQNLNLQQLFVDDILTPDFSELMLTDFVHRIPDFVRDEDEKAPVYVPVTRSLAWLGGPVSLKETTLRVILKSVPLSEMDVVDSPKSILSYIPPHLCPRLLPPDICGECQKPVPSILDEQPQHRRPKRYRKQILALRKVVLEYIFCSRRCLIVAERRWSEEDIDQQLRILQRGMRFMGIAHVPAAQA
ncbi:hypothetical protein POJ06DRAFT_261112 [Lipomyces tetrasporus]|uniref:Uncharacterized protein n=1 Tax=Lipomyces tetrasporus TaxID=54092 RepID=A0AAD7QLM1_9ASCO|nr:uncharacterized protein POJ06DRAFT_261112 [Lipomyces tetrasporus]KAJ8097338.1 hypothetical protein POJ06DRAFT_261112 [Lipomyces tetrasporus]